MVVNQLVWRRHADVRTSPPQAWSLKAPALLQEKARVWPCRLPAALREQAKSLPVFTSDHRTCEIFKTLQEEEETVVPERRGKDPLTRIGSDIPITENSRCDRLLISRTSTFPSFFHLGRRSDMSANPSGEIPDAWDDDWERQADVRICYLYPQYYTSLLVERCPPPSQSTRS